MVQVVDKCFGQSDSIIVMSIGVIGQRLFIDKIINNVLKVYSVLGGFYEYWFIMVKVICIIDIFFKFIFCIFILFFLLGVEYRIVGIIKGVGMIYFNMVIFLGVIVMDVFILLLVFLLVFKYVVDCFFNSIIIDGDMLINDIVVLLVNGMVGGKEVVEGIFDYEVFCEVFIKFFIELVQLIVCDGEGVIKFVIIKVVDFVSEEVVWKIVSIIVRLLFVKIVLYGKDVNWYVFLVCLECDDEI